MAALLCVLPEFCCLLPSLLRPTAALLSSCNLLPAVLLGVPWKSAAEASGRVFSRSLESSSGRSIADDAAEHPVLRSSWSLPPATIPCRRPPPDCGSPTISSSPELVSFSVCEKTAVFRKKPSKSFMKLARSAEKIDVVMQKLGNMPKNRCC